MSTHLPTPRFSHRATPHNLPSNPSLPSLRPTIDKNPKYAILRSPLPPPNHLSRRAYVGLPVPSASSPRHRSQTPSIPSPCNDGACASPKENVRVREARERAMVRMVRCGAPIACPARTHACEHASTWHRYRWRWVGPSMYIAYWKSDRGGTHDAGMSLYSVGEEQRTEAVLMACARACISRPILIPPNATFSCRCATAQIGRCLCGHEAA